MFSHYITKNNAPKNMSVWFFVFVFWYRKLWEENIRQVDQLKYREKEGPGWIQVEQWWEVTFQEE